MKNSLIPKMRLGGAVLAAALCIPAGLFGQSLESGDASAGTGGSRAPMYRPTPTPTPTSTKRTELWNGVYVGGFGGVVLPRAIASTSTVFATTAYFQATSVATINSAGNQRLDKMKFSGGGAAGYNYQSGNMVLGGEVDFALVNGTTSKSTTVPYTCCTPTTFTLKQSVDTSWLFTARPRIGFASGKTLVYATGGAAWTNLTYNANFTDTFANASENGGLTKSVWGWTGGAGFERRAWGHWSLKGEYLYAQFKRQTTTSTNLTTTGLSPTNVFPGNPFTHSITLKEHMFRIGLNFHF